MQFWALCWAASVVLAGALAAEPPTVEHHSADAHLDHKVEISKVEDQLARVAHRILTLEEKIDARSDPKRLTRVHSLEHRVEDIEGGNGCGRRDFFQCGGSDPQCINNLLVCDHQKDCRNGADEAHCDIPIHAGDKFVGDVVFDHCTKRKPDHMTLTIDSVTVDSYFPGFPRVSGGIEINYDRDYEGYVHLWSKGFYSFATSRIVFRPPEEDRLGFVAQFDGADFDTFVGTIRHEASREVCAKFIFHKQH